MSQLIFAFCYKNIAIAILKRIVDDEEIFYANTVNGPIVKSDIPEKCVIGIKDLIDSGAYALTEGVEGRMEVIKNTLHIHFSNAYGIANFFSSELLSEMPAQYPDVNLIVLYCAGERKFEFPVHWTMRPRK